MKVLLVHHSKGGDIYFDASDDGDAAYLALFKMLDEQGDYECCPPIGRQLEAYNLAKAGDSRWARIFLETRSRAGYEYEGISRALVVKP